MPDRSRVSAEEERNALAETMARVAMELINGRSAKEAADALSAAAEDAGAYARMYAEEDDTDELVARAEAAEARCESYRTALKRIVALDAQDYTPQDAAHAFERALSVACAALAVPQEGKPE